MKKVQLIPEFTPRLYQQSIFANSLNKNTLVVLPTGLGKTIIALMLSIYYFNQTNKKILFLAPTKPLVEQQEKSFKKFFQNKEEFNFQVLTGQVSPKKRTTLYQENDFIFSTPQLIENDIINNIINPNDFSLIIFDEAHRASKNYAYCFIAKEFNKSSVKILALTASPGTSIEEINNLLDNLKINQLEVKKNTDPDVKKYIQKTQIKKIEIELNENLLEIKTLLNQVFEKKLKHLQQLNFLKGKNKNTLTKKDLLDFQKELRVSIGSGDADENIWKAISLSAGLMKLQHGIELFESQEISVAYTYFYNFFRIGGDSSKAAEELTQDIDFREAFEKISKLFKKNTKHPKLIKLKEIVLEELTKNKNLKIIIFSQYRDSAQKIVQELNETSKIKSALFIGQSKKSQISLSQKQQKEILDKFRENHFNILVSTSVGEEGLDIPKVDLVIFYEPIASAIRTIQRIGRTGRFNSGCAYILQTKGTRDIVTSFIASAKERKMYSSLDKIIKERQNKSNNSNLTKFLHNTKSSNSQQNNNSNSHQTLQTNSTPLTSKYPIYIDNRENNLLIKELYNTDEIEVISKKLEIADIIFDQYTAIERKEKTDFINSIIDNRLFPQLINLSNNYKNPILILEGKENLFSIRNISPNVIRSTLATIAIDLKIPIIYTDSLFETAQMILTIAKRLKKEKKEISLADNKKSFSPNQELEKVISTIPTINVVNAKNLLSSYKSIKNLVNTNEKKLQTLEGIGPKRAKFLTEFFNRKYEK